MAKYRRRKYYKKYYRRYRKISENYFKARVEAVGKVTWPVGVGAPILYLSNDVYGSVLTFQEILRQTTYIVMLKGMFSFYRLTGMSMEFVPDASNTNGVKQVDNETSVMVAPRAGDDALMTFGEIKSVNSAILLNAMQTTRRYTKFYGYTGDWIDTGVFPKGAVSIAAQSNAAVATSPTWNFRFVLYLLYKKSKI